MAGSLVSPATAARWWPTYAVSCWALSGADWRSRSRPMIGRAHLRQRLRLRDHRSRWSLWVADQLRAHGTSIVPTSACGWNRPTNQRANHRRRCRGLSFLSGLTRPGRAAERTGSHRGPGRGLSVRGDHQHSGRARGPGGGRLDRRARWPADSLFPRCNSTARPDSRGGGSSLEGPAARGPKRQKMTFHVRTGSPRCRRPTCPRFTCRAERSTNPPPTAESGTVPGAVAAGSVAAPAPSATPTPTPTPTTTPASPAAALPALL